MKRRTLSRAVLATVILAGVCGTANVSRADTTKKTFTMSIIDNGNGFDPGLFSWDLIQDSLGIFEGLVHAGPDGKAVPGMATSWKADKTRKVWTFTLRNNIRYSNGDPITAQDFVYAMQRAVDPHTAEKTKASPVPINFIHLVNIEECRAGTKPVTALGVKALNNDTLQLTLSTPDANLPQELTLWQNGWIVPLDKKVVEKMSQTDWSDPAKIVSNGPYMVQSYSAKTAATLVPNPYYYQHVNLDKINFVYTTTNQLLAYKSGSLDMAVLQSTDIPAINGDPSLKKDLHMWTTSAQYSFFPSPSNNRLLLNPTIRKALEMAIDKQTIAQKVLNGTGVPAYEYDTPTWLDPWIKDKSIPYDPKQAKQLLAKAGYPDGKGFPTVQLLVGTTSDYVAEAIQQMWQNTLGIKVKFLGEEWGQYLSDLNKVLPNDTIGFVQSGANASYPNLMLPTNPELYINSHMIQFLGYLPPDQAQKWVDLSNNKSMDPKEQLKQQISIIDKYLPKNIMNLVQQGYQAYKSGNVSMMKHYYWNRAQNVLGISVYTPVNPVLLRSDVKGYYPNRFLLTNPPLWLGYISRG
jgi:oligopeptide transport system substrate-binding protein